ncbi:MAG: response regulator, partial [Desulfovibrionaceae bacterium]
MNNKVLLVDDESGVRTVIGVVLADAGYEVIEAENGIQALDRFEEFRPSVVLTDIKMPGVDGL